MYTSIKFINNDNEEIDFNANVDPNGFIALQTVNMTLNGRNVDRPKMEAMGSWATFQYYSSLTIELEGSMVCGSPDQLTLYRQTVLQKLLPPPTIQQDTRTHGAIRFRYLGFDEDYSIPVVVQSVDIPSGTDRGPSAAPFRCACKAFRPYAFGMTSAQYYWVVG